MGPKKGRRVRKIEVPTENVPEFELGDTVADIQQRRDDKEARESKEAQVQQQKKRQGGRRQEWGNHTRKRRELQKNTQDRKK